MNSNRFNFTQPYWEFALPLLSWLFMLPILVWSEPRMNTQNFVSGLVEPLSWLLANKVNLYVVSSLSIMCLSWSIGVIISNHELLRKRNYLPSGLAAFFGSFSILSLGFSFSYFAVFFFIQSLNSLMHVRRESQSYDHLFNAGFLLSIGCLVDMRLWMAFPFLLIGMLALRKLSLRDFLIIGVSVLNVLFIVGCVHLLVVDSIPELSTFNSCSRMWFSKLNSNSAYAISACVGVLSLVGVGFSEIYIAKLNNSEKRRFRILMYFGLAIFVLSSMWSLVNVALIETSFFIAPLALAVTIYATSISNKWLRRLMYLCFILLIGLWAWFFFK